MGGRTLNNVKLNRSIGFKIICGIIFLLIIFVAAINIYALIKWGFIEYFFGDSNFFKISSNAGLAMFFVGVQNIFVFIIDIPWFCFIEYLLFISVFFNRISVKEDKILLLFAPRLFYRTSINNISKITPVSSDEIPWYKKVLSFNFQKDNLYHFLCYDTEFTVASKDTQNMEALMREVNSRNNKTEKDEPDYVPPILSKGEKIFLVTIAAWIISSIFGLVDGF